MLLEFWCLDFIFFFQELISSVNQVIMADIVPHNMQCEKSCASSSQIMLTKKTQLLDHLRKKPLPLVTLSLCSYFFFTSPMWLIKKWHTVRGTGVWIVSWWCHTEWTVKMTWIQMLIFPPEIFFLSWNNLALLQQENIAIFQIAIFSQNECFMSLYWVVHFIKMSMIIQ